MVSSASFGPTCHTCLSTSRSTVTAATVTGGRSDKYPSASMTLLLSSYPAHAGILSGFPGIESVPGPELPKIDSLTRFNEENQKRYAENDARFRESPLLKELLERSKLNKEKNRQAIQDKYCIRGAEWGVGDCSAEGMTQQEREEFIMALKKKAGIE
ncbi:hypothetical protein HanXRQr2_Chr12g0560591 [Helianthus annuus]|uniref:Uncharacterized protein n=1 Tax=Helianthus annuus TaxID=4232 RepID=A0A9K3HJW3_HELAN|nr:hypothetical protein HanXRQr2_Chr12g0560591 [Helianthus annuus]